MLSVNETFKCIHLKAPVKSEINMFIFQQTDSAMVRESSWAYLKEITQHNTKTVYKFITVFNLCLSLCSQKLSKNVDFTLFSVHDLIHTVFYGSMFCRITSHCTSKGSVCHCTVHDDVALRLRLHLGKQILYLVSEYLVSKYLSLEGVTAVSV